MSLTTEKDGPPIATVKGADGIKEKWYVKGDVLSTEGGVRRVDFGPEDQLTPIPYILKNQRTAVYITGAAGSGKSTMIANMIKGIKGKRDVLLFTAAEDMDPVFEKVDMKKVDYIKEPGSIYGVTLKDLKDSVCVFDDFETLEHPKINVFIYSLINSILENGRKLNISLFTVSHNPRNWLKTRTIILESDTLVVFPATNRHAALSFLKQYYDADKEFLEDVKNVNDAGRFSFCVLHRNVPRYMLTAKSIRLLY